MNLLASQDALRHVSCFTLGSNRRANVGCWLIVGDDVVGSQGSEGYVDVAARSGRAGSKLIGTEDGRINLLETIVSLPRLTRNSKDADPGSV